MHVRLNRLSQCLVLTLGALVGCAYTGASWREASPEEKAAVIGAVQTFFDAMAARDVEAASASLVPEGRIWDVGDEDGSGGFDNAGWLSRLAGRWPGSLETKMGTSAVLISGDVVMVGVEYTFAMDGEPSHTGIKMFMMVKTETGWKIAPRASSGLFPDED